LIGFAPPIFDYDILVLDKASLAQIFPKSGHITCGQFRCFLVEESDHRHPRRLCAHCNPQRRLTCEIICIAWHDGTVSFQDMLAENFSDIQGIDLTKTVVADDTGA
jgi:hypothetical protein